jgi:hypothetical protein
MNAYIRNSTAPVAESRLMIRNPRMKSKIVGILSSNTSHKGIFRE